MGSKGFSQVDLAIGVAFMIFIIVLVIAYSSRELANPLSTAQSIEARASSDALAESLFGDRGTPANWHNVGDEKNIIRPSFGEYIYRTKVRVVEVNGSSQNNKVLRVELEIDEKGTNKTFIVYDGTTPLQTNLHNQTDSDGDGLPTKVNVTFKISVAANSEKIASIYYSNDSLVNSSYTSLTEDSVTNLTATRLSEERLLGTAPKKLISLNSTFNISEFKDRFAIDDSFRIEIDNTTAWSYGSTLPDGEEVFISRRNILFQNLTAHINSTQGRVYVW